MNRTLACAAAAASMLASTAHANLILNGSFELPATPVGGYTVYDYFENIGAWQVSRIGMPVVFSRIVAVVNASYTESGYSFPASDGDNWVDLTGLLTGVTAGVLQNFVSVPGQTYRVSFDVGNVSGGSFGQSSSVGLLIPGAGQFTFTNSTPGTTMNWQRFSVEYVADAVSSGFFFWNLDPQGDNVNGLDNVVVEAVLPTAVVPVPGALPLLLGGVGLLAGFAARRRG